MIKKIYAFLNRGGQRTSIVKKNILATFFVKGISVIISLLYVPITLNYLNPTRYGIWMTLTSVVAWIGIFDVGLGNGLRNKLTETLAVNDKIKARKYVSTAYAILSFILIIVLFVFFIVNRWIDWTVVLNTTADYGEELKLLVISVVTLFAFKFVLNIISTVFTADQRPAIANVFEMIGNAIGLFIIMVLINTNKTSLLTFGIATMLTPVFIYLIASFYFFNNKYLDLKPSWKTVDLSLASDLMGLGFKFFVIQIAVLVIFQTSNILIAQFFSPAEVTPYNIVFKYFNVLTMIWSIILTPLWSAFTQAYVKNDLEWIKKILKKLNIMMFISTVIIIIMAIISIPVIKIWTLNQIQISPKMIWILALYTFISMWNIIYASFLNGISEMKIQMITSIIAALINVPLAFFFVKYLEMGSEGIALSMAISLSLFGIAGPIQTYKILRSWKRN